METPEGVMNYIVARCTNIPSKHNFFCAFMDEQSALFFITDDDSIEKLNEILKEDEYNEFPGIHLRHPFKHRGIALDVITTRCEKGSEGSWNINGHGKIHARYPKQDNFLPLTGIVHIEVTVSGKVNLDEGCATLNLLEVD